MRLLTKQQISVFICATKLKGTQALQYHIPPYLNMQGLWNLIGKVGQGSTQAFPYEIGEKFPALDGKSIWTLHKGKKKVRQRNLEYFFFVEI